MNVKKVIGLFFFVLITSTYCGNNRRAQVDINYKNEEIKRLTERAIKFFESHTVDESCTEFLKNPKWQIGEIFPFIFDENGICYVHGPEYDLIWKNISSILVSPNVSLIQAMLKIGDRGDYLSYFWDNGFKTSYVQTIEKDGVTYVIGSGFFPVSSRYKAKQIVTSAVQLFEFQGKDYAFSLINSPRNILSHGNIFAFAYDFEGMCFAYGSNFTYVGLNRLNTKDSQGKFMVKEFIDVAKSPAGEGWVSYVSKNATKLVYVKKVKDKKTGKEYVIGAGYYPDQNFNTAKELAANAVKYLKQVGAKKAFEAFNDVTGPFCVGGLAVSVLGLDGYCYANGENLEYVNHNVKNFVDDKGRYFMQILLDAYKDPNVKNFTGHYNKYNAEILGYSEKVDISDGKFIVGVNYYPNSKSFSTKNLVDDAVIELQNTKSVPSALSLFNSKKSQFFVGDLQVYAYDSKGICLANSYNKSLIWEDYNSNPTSKAVIDMIRNKAFSGGGWVEYTINNARRRSYIQLAKTNTPLGKKNIIVGSGYFL